MKKSLATALATLSAALVLSACSVEDVDSAASSDTATVVDDAAKSNFTTAQQNAIRSAQGYLSMSGFSRRGLIDQLSSAAGDGYKRSNAVFAVNHIKVNWNKQAVRSGRSYLEMSGFSRSGLIEQLSSNAGDKYTRAQAEFAADKLGL